VNVPNLTAGAIDQVAPTPGTILTVSGSNATAQASSVWQESADAPISWSDIVGQTGTTLDTTGFTAGTRIRYGVGGLSQGLVYTADVQIAAAAIFTDPTDLGSKLIFWGDMTDTSVLYQDTAGTTPATTASDPVRRVNDKSGNANHIMVGGGTPGNGVLISGGVDWNNCAMLGVSSLTGLTSGMEGFTLLDPIGESNDSWILLGINGNSSAYAGIAQNGNFAAPDGTIGGTIQHFVNGTEVTTPTRDKIYDSVIAAGPGFVTRHLTGIDLTGYGATLIIIGYNTASIRFDGDVRHVVITTGLTYGERTDLLAYLAAEAA